MTTTILIVRLPLALAIVVAVIAAALAFHAQGGPERELALSLAFGAAFGLVLQRARFCFLCNFRDFVTERDPRGLLSIIVALAVGAIGYALVFGAWMPVPTPDRLPPDAHIGPVSWVLAMAAFVFGLGMAISGSCLSAHFYRLGEGSPTSPFALVGAAAGFALGFITWNGIYLAAVSDAVPVWLPHHLGYAGTLALTFVVLGLLALLVLRFGRTPAPVTDVARAPLAQAVHAVFVARWPGVIGGILVGVISALAYFRVAPLGVTAELGSLVRTAASGSGLLPDTLFGLDGFRGCATAIKETLFSNNGVFVLGLIAASFASALVAGQFKPSWPTPGQIVKGLTGGVLMGWGAMTALGCTVGVLMSGIHAGALAGWVFLAACVAGIWFGLRLLAALARPDGPAARL